MFNKIIPKLSLFLSLLFIACLAVFTFVEKFQDSGFVKEQLYYSPWFTAIFICLALSSFGRFLFYQKNKNLSTISLYISFLIIVLGYFLTLFTGIKGRIHLREGQMCDCFLTQKQQTRLLPFTITLQSFEIEYFDGTNMPKNYNSTVVINEEGRQSIKNISLNSILSHRHFRFYQTSFDRDEKGSVFSVKYDPIGISVTYLGYALFSISMLMVLFHKKGRFRLLLKTAVLLLLVFSPFSLYTQPNTLSKEQAAQMGKWQVLHNNRMMPLQTLAKDFTLKITGKDHYKEFSAEQVFFGWIFYPQQWQEEPLIGIKNKPLRQLLRTKTISYNELFSAENKSIIADYCLKLERENKQNSLHKSVYEINEKWQLITQLQNGELLCLFPCTVSDRIVWYSPTSQLSDALPEEEKQLIRGYFSVMHQAVIAGNTESINELTQLLADFQQKQGGNSLLSRQKTQMERLYNALPFASLAYRFYLVLGIVGFIFLIYKRKTRPTDKILFILYLTAFLFLTFFISLRIGISGRLPLGNGYETLLFLSWVSGLIALLVHKKLPLLLPFGFLLSGFILLVSTLMNPQITPLMPILLSTWLSIHVSVIMLSYAFFSFTFLNAVATLIFSKIGKNAPIERISVFSRIFLYLGIFLLGIGIFTGAVWANSAWGDYWSWDPKEVWALITLMVYGLALHPAVLAFNNNKTFHIYLLFAFVCVIMTYFGVNYFLGGMHGYA